VSEGGVASPGVLLNELLDADGHVVIIQLFLEQILYLQKLAGLSFDFEVTPRFVALDTFFVACHEVSAIGFELSSVKSM
jgi:hypothetical protein